MTEHHAPTPARRNREVAVIGAGPMGLAAAYQLLQDGHRVTLYEAGPVIGGMSAAFDFDGTPIERYYHFICATDQAMFDLLEELELGHTLHWRATRMGFFLDGRLHDWGNPLALLRLPGLGPVAKLRYGLHAYLCTRRSDWQALDRQHAAPWLRRWVGRRAYQRLWQPLLGLKFHHHTEALSAAWMWNRIHRVGRSRYSLMREKLGYLAGGSQTLLDALRQRIEAAGGRIHLDCPVQQVTVRDGAVRGVRLADGEARHDAVLSTVPLPLVRRMIPDLPAPAQARLQALESLAVVCVIFKLHRPLSDKFWININDPAMDIPGLVEYTNLRPMDSHIVYVPYYVPGDHPIYQQDDASVIDRAWRHLCRINPALTQADRLAAHASRYRHAQPVCRPGHLNRLPPVDTGIAGLLMADTNYYYPEDRGISESVRFGRKLARRLND